MPAAIHKGNSIQLHCEFELQHSLLYSVKFYKDYIEFYRQVATFPIGGDLEIESFRRSSIGTSC